MNLTRMNTRISLTALLMSVQRYTHRRKTHGKKHGRMHGRKVVSVNGGRCNGS